MKLHLRIQLLFGFYLSFILYSLAVDAAAAMLYAAYGSGIFPMLWLLKFITLLFTCYTIHRRKKSEYYYYYNQGLSLRQIWIPVLVFDICLFLCITLVFHA